MQRHILDEPRKGETARLARFVTLERRERLNGPHHAINVLRRQPKDGPSPTRLKAFAALERMARS